MGFGVGDSELVEYGIFRTYRMLTCALNTIYIGSLAALEIMSPFGLCSR